MSQYLATLAALVVCTAAAHATNVVDVTGPTYLSKGEGFRAVATGAEVKPGDRVLVGRGGRATVAFADGCRVSLAAGDVLTIPQASPCITGTSQTARLDLSGRMGQQVAEVVPPICGTLSPAQCTALGIIGAGGLAAGVAFAIANSHSDDEEPPSVSP